MVVIDSKVSGEDVPQKRKRGRPKLSTTESLSLEEREARVDTLRKEIDGLFGYYREVMDGKLYLNATDCGSVDAAIAVLLEESKLPLSELVAQLYEKLKETNWSGVTPATVKSIVVSVGQRVMYGMPTDEADVLEDDTHSCLWCWETRDVKLMPGFIRGVLKIRRTCRKKIQERISAAYAMIAALQNVDSCQNYKSDPLKVLVKLGKVLNEAEIRLLIDGMTQKYGTEMAEKEAKQEEKQLIKQLEKNKREAEKERKRKDRDLQREKQLQEEAERRSEKEDGEVRKLLRKQVEEAEKDQQRFEREKTELKRKLAIQKQASLMERFLKRCKTDSSCQNNQSFTRTISSDSLVQKSEGTPEAVTVSMDNALSSNEETSTDFIRKLHISSWRCLGQSIRLNGETWGQRQKPKTTLIREIKLTAGKGVACDDKSSMEKLVDGWGGKTSCDSLIGSPNIKKHKQRQQLLQFDKSHRPAFYGIWPSRSNVIGPRHPLRQDPELDYEIDSDEEWEEEDPGESLSDCDKNDEEESLEERRLKADDVEDESEDGFFVPDGYLSENEGVQVDPMQTDTAVGEAKSSLDCEQGKECEELSTSLQQQKYLHNLTEHALRKNQPLLILNLVYKKKLIVHEKDLTGTPKLGQTCLQALSMCLFPGGSTIDISVTDSMQNKNEDACSSINKSSIKPVPTTKPDLDLPAIVTTIQTCPHGINKVVEALHNKFPATPKSQLRNKVREVSDFVDNRWQARKDVLNKLGMSSSPERSFKRTKTIATFFSKRCLPPSAATTIHPNQTSAESCHQKQEDCSHNQV